MSVAKLKEQDDLVADVKAIVALLKEREWAEHCTKSRPGRELESLITDMHDEIAELQQKLDALEDKLRIKQNHIRLRDSYIEELEAREPVVDADYLNSVRAEGVEMVARSIFNQGNTYQILMRHAELFRSGTHDTADKAG